MAHPLYYNISSILVRASEGGDLWDQDVRELMRVRSMLLTEMLYQQGSPSPIEIRIERIELLAMIEAVRP
jgi:hypothetical protein